MQQSVLLGSSMLGAAASGLFGEEGNVFKAAEVMGSDAVSFRPDNSVSK